MTRRELMTDIPEPTSPTAVVVGNRNGETVVVAQMDDDDTQWAMQYPDGGLQWCSWETLRRELTDIRVVDAAELAAEIDQLKARIAELESAPALSVEQVSVLDSARMCLMERHWEVSEAIEKAFPEAFELEPEPEPGADIPDEVVGAAWRAFDASFGAMRDALAAADAKRAELAGGEQA